MQRFLCFLCLGILGLLGCESKQVSTLVLDTPKGVIEITLFPEYELASKSFSGVNSGQFTEGRAGFGISSDFQLPKGEKEEVVADHQYHIRGAVSLDPKSRMMTIITGRKMSQQELAESAIDFDQLEIAFGEYMKDPANQPVRDEYEMFRKEGSAEDLQNLLLAQVEILSEVSDIEIMKPIPDNVSKTYLDEGGAPWLDGQSLVVGKVTKGMDIVDQLTQSPQSGESKFSEPISFKIKF